jgi:flagellar export protein FliJ
MLLLESKKSPRIADLAKFVFNLEILLQHRARLEQRERDELFRRNYRYQLELRNREGLNAKLNTAKDELNQKQAESPSSEEFNLFYLYINRLNKEIRESEKRLALLDSEVQKQKEIVIEASKKKKSLASLRAKKEKEFIYALEKQEQKEMDELVATRYAIKDPERSTQAATFKKERQEPHESRSFS